MIARVGVLLTYSINVYEGQKFDINPYIEEGYEVRIFPPIKSKSVKKQDAFLSGNVSSFGGVPLFQADVIQIDFVKERFDRRKDIFDPPSELIERVINGFLTKLRFVTREHQIKPVRLILNAITIHYLNDDGAELPNEKELIRYRALGPELRFKPYAVLNSQIWEDVNRLPPDFVPPEWDCLLLDAIYLLPEIGPAIILAMTALEVFISKILNSLAEKNSIPQELWAWINNRDWWLKEPAVEEQFDVLLRNLADISLKTNNDLWEAFSHLRRARNSFVHDGVAKLGSQALHQADAYRLVKAAGDIIEYVRERLPEEMRWPQLQY